MSKKSKAGIEVAYGVKGVLEKASCDGFGLVAKNVCGTREPMQNALQLK